MTSEEILKELSAQTEHIRNFEGATFELLEDYWAIADTRISAFSSDKMWAVVVEVIGFDRGGDYTSRIYLYGNCLTEESTGSEFCGAPILTMPKAWNREAQMGIARDAFALRWRGQRFDFAPTIGELKAAGIELSNREIESGELTPQQMLRYVCEKLDHPFFFSEDNLRDLLYQNGAPFEWKYDEKTQRQWYENKCGEFDEPPVLNIYLELILQTRDWVHPRAGAGDGSLGSDDWEISPEEAFETLSQVLAKCDVSIWEQQDKSKFNSHWKNWAETEINIERAQIEAIESGKRELRAFLNELPLAEQEEILLVLREHINESPSITHSNGLGFVQVGFMEYEGRDISLFSELSEEIDNLLSKLQHP